MIRALAVAIALPVSAQAQDTVACWERTALLRILLVERHQFIQSSGVTQGGNVLETFANNRTREWTLVVSEPGGMSCVISTGYAFDPGDGEQS